MNNIDELVKGMSLSAREFLETALDEFIEKIEGLNNNCNLSPIDCVELGILIAQLQKDCRRE